jgi:hypothetical protein
MAPCFGRGPFPVNQTMPAPPLVESVETQPNPHPSSAARELARSFPLVWEKLFEGVTWVPHCHRQIHRHVACSG